MDPARADPTVERITLADWRRRVADLYAEVRGMAATDPAIAHAHWRAVREELFRTHPQSPVAADGRAAFAARHWPYDPAWRLVAPVRPAPPPEPGALTLELPNSGADTLAFERVGTLELTLPGGPARLSLFWMLGYSGGVFLPFRDATSGRETYAAGRYLLDTAKSADLGTQPSGDLILDFNFAYQPSCAFDPRWACPLAPPENRLEIAVAAGERMA